MMKRIVVLVSGGGTNLQALINAQNSGKIPHGKIIAVISSSAKAYAIERARNAQIPCYIIARSDFRNNEEMSSALISKIKELKADLIVLAGFMFILSSDFIQTFRNHIINVHPALIPSFCGEGYYGIHVHEKALQYGVKVSGATIHFVSEDCDGGPIILQKAVNVEEDDTPEKLQRRIMEQAEWILLPEAVNLFCEDRLSIEGRIVHIKTGEE